MSTPHQNPDDPHWYRSNKAKLAILLAVLGIVGSFLANFLLEKAKSEGETDTKPPSASSQPPSSPPTPPEPSSEPPSPSSDTPKGDSQGEDTQTQEPTYEPSKSDAPRVASRTMLYLSNIEGTRNENATLVHQGQQRQCLTSLMVRAHLFQDVKTLEYAIDPGWDTFSVLAGMDTAPPTGNTMRFTVYVDDEQVAAYELSDRQAQEITVPVNGKSNLKLVTKTVKAAEIPAGGYGAWGNARFTRGSPEQGGC